jgi:hypothetical protein
MLVRVSKFSAPRLPYALYPVGLSFHIFCVHFFFHAALGPGVYSASNRYEYQKHKNNHVSGE